MKKAAAIICVFQLCLTTPCAQAMQIFDFSFDNFNGNTAGPITGEIHFDEIGDFTGGEAEKVIITGVGGHAATVTFPIPTDVIAGGWSIIANSFDVLAGLLTSWDFAARDLTGGISFLDFSVPGVEAYFESQNGGNSTISSVDGIAFTRRPSAVPEPGVIALLCLGLAGLGVTRRRVKA